MITTEKFQNQFTDGLNDSQVEVSRQKYGENTLTPPPRTSLWKLYFDKYRDPIIQILLVAAAISLALAFVENEFLETIGIFLAIFLATTVGFYFECDAAKKFNVLTTFGEEQLVKVRRDGHVKEIARKDVVVGDIILVEVGDEIPADGELFRATDLQIDESSLTGEPICTKRVLQADSSASKADDKHTYPQNIILRSTMVMNGSGMARVTAVGDATEIGKVARKSTEVLATKTPLNIQLEKLAKLISKIGFTIAIASFLIFLIHDIIVNDAVWQSDNYLKMVEIVLGYFMMAVTLIVMAVPEGLPMAVTLSLALNMRRMLKSNNLVRKLHACETMGAVTVICTDKTGTLTQNKMQVREIDIDKDADNMGEGVANEDLLDAAIAINSTAELDGNNGIGNPTEVALLLWMQDRGCQYAHLRSTMEVVKQLPFSTERKYMATIAKIASGETYLFVKGAPEIVLSFCDMIDSKRQSVQTLLLNYQSKAMRTLAFACRKIDYNNEEIELLVNNLSYQAVAAISDPVRVDVPSAVTTCSDAGIEIKMVTGDTSATAVEIAKQIGIWNVNDSAASLITGAEWMALTDDEAFERAKMIKVMSRARPTDKQRLVEMLQKHGEVVAVTGDGTNDAPALNYAHVGLSLGSGTSVAKEASDMTLLDDSFSSIANAVMWGRSLYRNIQRFLFFQLVVNVTALLLVLGGSFIGTEMPLTVTQILWVNLIMDTFAALALASLPPSHDVMKEKPRKQTDFIITRGMSQGILFCGLLFFVIMFAYLIYCEYNVAGVQRHELTRFFTAFVMLQFWNLFNAKTLGSNRSAFRHFILNKGLMLVVLLIFIGQWLIVTFGGDMFRTEPMSLVEWVVITALTSSVMWIGELWRMFKRMKHARN